MGSLLVLLVLPALAYAAGQSTAGGPPTAAGSSTTSAPSTASEPAADPLAADDSVAADADDLVSDPPPHSPSFGPPEQTPGIPSSDELEAAGAVIGEVLIDNQNIFNLEDPKDDNWLFRAADDLHPRTRADVIRHQLLFKPGEPYNRRMIDESERILRADGDRKSVV